MSMRDYAIDDYGLLLDNETIKVIAHKVIDGYVEDINNIDLAYELYERGICEYVSEFTGEASEVDSNGFYWGGECEEYSGDVITYVQASNYPTLFKRAYNDIDELVEEFKNKIGEYLPEDFDYRSNIRHICGTYYG